MILERFAKWGKLIEKLEIFTKDQIPCKNCKSLIDFVLWNRALYAEISIEEMENSIFKYLWGGWLWEEKYLENHKLGTKELTQDQIQWESSFMVCWHFQTSDIAVQLVSMTNLWYYLQTFSNLWFFLIPRYPLSPPLEPTFQTRDIIVYLVNWTYLSQFIFHTFSGKKKKKMPDHRTWRVGEY